ncbi:MAG: endonuclease III [Proteobacteria bacterium]|nr:endonuclease III [Pseudomonadota bacterium]MDA0952302.1 endonuclease III [Pseudomonadota bacterium]MDA1069823.1 endonuclease III [Pseudomonadota bacterium]
MKRADIDRLFSALAEVIPAPKTELEYTNSFTLLVSVVLSAQATDKGVNAATPGLFALADTPQAMLELGEEGVREKIKTIGLFNAKARNVIALSRILIERHGGEVPASREALQALPGVGRKTASVVMNEAFGEATIAVDTHVFRVANRTGLAPGRTPDAVEKKLEAIVPERWKKGAHHWLILHGRYTCLARKPHCWICVIADICPFKPKTPDPEEEARLKAEARVAGRRRAPPTPRGETRRQTPAARKKAPRAR